MAKSYRASVVGAKELEAQFGEILHAFKPPQIAQILLRGAEELVGVVQDHILQQGLVDSGEMYDSVKAVKINQWTAGVEVSVPYAAVHEFGLQHQVATAKQIRFFWAMFGDTGDSMWRALALKGWYTIPARPYFRPAVDEGKHAALEAIMREAAAVLSRIAKVGGK